MAGVLDSPARENPAPAAPTTGDPGPRDSLRSSGTSLRVRQLLCPAPGALLCAPRADAGGRAEAGEDQPRAGHGTRTRPGRARLARRRGDPRRQPHRPGLRADRAGLCRPPVRPLRAATRRWPRHPAGRGGGSRGPAPRYPAQGLWHHAVLPQRRWTCGPRAGAAGIHRERGDGGPGDSHHAHAGGRHHRRDGVSRDGAARCGADPRRLQPHPGRDVPVLRRARRSRGPAAPGRPRDRTSRSRRGRRRRALSRLPRGGGRAPGQPGGAVAARWGSSTA